jgi:hypothetical protein
VHLAAASRFGDLLDAAEGSGVQRIVVLARTAPRADGYEVVVLRDRRGRFRTPPDVLEALADAVVAADRRR